MSCTQHKRVKCSVFPNNYFRFACRGKFVVKLWSKLQYLYHPRYCFYYTIYTKCTIILLQITWDNQIVVTETACILLPGYMLILFKNNLKIRNDKISEYYLLYLSSDQTFFVNRFSACTGKIKQQNQRHYTLVSVYSLCKVYQISVANKIKNIADGTKTVHGRSGSNVFARKLLHKRSMSISANHSSISRIMLFYTFFFCTYYKCIPNIIYTYLVRTIITLIIIIMRVSSCCCYKTSDTCTI